MRFRSMDWGSASPFSVGWWAIVQDTTHSPMGASSCRAGAWSVTANGMECARASRMWA